MNKYTQDELNGISSLPDDVQVAMRQGRDISVFGAKCYDCGSTIEWRHTKTCEMGPANAVRDLPAKPNTQHWTGKLPA